MTLMRRLHALWREWSLLRRLGSADDRMLADLGISRAQACFEAERMPWRLRTR